MLKENNPLLKLEVKEEESKAYNFLKAIYESFYFLFDLILEDSIDSFWYECIGIIIGYGQIILYLFDKTVSK